MMDLREKNKHLYNRTSFGWTREQYAHPKEINEAVARLFPKAECAQMCVITQEEWVANNPKAMKEMEESAKKMMQKSFREKVVDLNLLWMEEMSRTDQPFLEKMSLFWHGHFACRIDNPYFNQLLLQDIRTHALGNFGDLLKAVSKSPAMLNFLNNQQNKKAHPNENFAREVMELFTLGRGNYTETDIKEAARAFTGWAYDDDGAFVFRKKQHDGGSKTILGETGNFDGDNVLIILLKQKQTAVFICNKLYRYFVNDEQVNDKHVQELAEAFYKSGYDIAAVMKTMLTADWFYSDINKAALIKSPVDLLVGYMRTLPMDFKSERTLLNLQRVLGQALFYPPNVAGWPGGKNWIDSSSLVIRMRLPEAFYASKEIDLSAKEIEPEMGSAKDGKMNNKLSAEKFKVGKVDTEWNAYIDFWEAQGKNLAEKMTDYFISAPVSKAHIELLSKYADKDTPEELIKSLTILIMKTPEYQLC